MGNRELILNLWYVRDEEGIIYSLRAKVYVGEGSDEEKLEFLKQRAKLDYLVAEPFAIPENFFVNYLGEHKPKIMNVGHLGMLQTFGSPIAIFEKAIKTLESRIPVQSKMKIPMQPIVCTTALMQNEEGIIEPRIDS